MNYVIQMLLRSLREGKPRELSPPCFPCENQGVCVPFRSEPWKEVERLELQPRSCHTAQGSLFPLWSVKWLLSLINCHFIFVKIILHIGLDCTSCSTSQGSLHKLALSSPFLFPSPRCGTPTPVWSSRSNFYRCSQPTAAECPSSAARTLPAGHCFPPAPAALGLGVLTPMPVVRFSHFGIKYRLKHGLLVLLAPRRQLTV